MSFIYSVLIPFDFIFHSKIQEKNTPLSKGDDKLPKNSIEDKDHEKRKMIVAQQHNDIKVRSNKTIHMLTISFPLQVG